MNIVVKRENGIPTTLGGWFFVSRKCGWPKRATTNSVVARVSCSGWYPRTKSGCFQHTRVGTRVPNRIVLVILE